MSSTEVSKESPENVDYNQDSFNMEDSKPLIVSGEAEIIIVKPDSIELLFDAEDSLLLEEDVDHLEFENLDKNCFVTTSGEVITLNYEDLVQTPFCLENYFMDNDGFRSRSFCMPIQPLIIDRVTCYECDTVFCNEHKLLEHLMTHIDVNKMGCNVCDKDLNLEEKFQLHIMAVTWQSIYYCDFCRKSCAGVVRSKSQLPPPGKTYMCHDCENRTKQVTENLQTDSVLHRNIESETEQQTLKSNDILSPPISHDAFSTNSLVQPPPTDQSVSSLDPFQFSSLSNYVVPVIQPILLPPPTEVLQDHKQKPVSEVKYEIYEHNSTIEVQDCYKSPPKKKENKIYGVPKPRVQVVSESMRHILKMSTRSRTKSKTILNYKCRHCPVTFSENFLLTAHLREKHKFHKLKYECKVCKKEFVEQSCYKDHVGFNQITKNHMCFECNLTFLSKCELEQHEKLHTKNETHYKNSNNVVALDLRKKSKNNK